MSLQVQAWRTATTPSASATNYVALINGQEWDATEHRGTCVCTAAGTLENLKIVLPTAPGASKSLTFTVRINGADTAAVIAISGTATSGTYTATAIALADGDELTLKCVPSGTPALSNPSVSWEFKSTTAGESIYGSGNTDGPIAAARTNGLLNPGDVSNWSANNTGTIVGIAGAISKATIKLDTAAGGSGSVIFTIQKNGVLQNGAGGTPDTTITFTGSTVKASTTASVPVSAGDELFWVSTQTGTPATVRPITGVRLTATTAGQSHVGGCGNANVLTGGVTRFYFPIQGQDGTDSPGDATESNRAVTLGLTGIVITDLRVKLNSTPGTGESHTATIRKNGASTALTAAVSGAGTSASVAASVSFAAGDTITMQWVSTAGAATRTPGWGACQDQTAGEVVIDPVTTVIAQLPVEVLAEIPGTARLAHLPVEVLAAIDGAARISHLPVEVLAAIAGTARLSQHVVEILIPAPVPALPAPGPGPIAWVEWQSLAPGAPELTRTYSDWDLQDPPGYYHGFKEARVERFGEASRTLSEPRTGDWQGSRCDLRLSDFDRSLRSRLASATERFWTADRMTIRIVSRATRAILGSPLTVFVGPIRSADPAPALSVEIGLEDVIGHGMLNDEHQIPQRRIDATDFDPTIEVVEDAKGRPVPIVYGTHAREQGAIAPIYLGLEHDGTDHVWLVAGHYAGVTDVFVGGVSVLGTAGVDWTIPGYAAAPAYEEIAGKRYTLIRGRAGQPAALTDPILYSDNSGVGVARFEEWIASYPLGGMPPGVGVRWDVNSTNTPHGGSRCIEGIDLREGELVRGHFGLSGPPGTAVPRGYVLTDYDNLKIWIKNGTSFWGVGGGLEITWFLGPPILIDQGISVVVSDGLYGFDETNVTTWQEVTIPIADFMLDPGDRADYVVIRKTGATDITMSLDDLSLEGTVPEGELTQADLAARGDSPITANVTGWTSNGNDTGTVIEAIHDQYKHFLINYVANPDGYLTGGPLDNPEMDLFDHVVTVVEPVSFARAKAQAITRYPPNGYLGAAVLGATAGDRLPVREWIARWNLSADCRFGVTRYGQLFIVMSDPTEADRDAAPIFEETLEILEGTFSIEVGWTVQATRIPFHAGYDYARGEWTIVRDAEDVALSEAYGRPEGIPGALREYWFIADSDQAKNVGEHEVSRVGDPPRVLLFETALGELASQELGGYITVRHFAGVGPSVDRLCQIEELTIAVGPRRVRVRALDVTARVAPVVVPEGAAGARIGFGRIGVMRIGYDGS